MKKIDCKTFLQAFYDMHFAFFDPFLPFLYNIKLISSILKILT